MSDELTRRVKAAYDRWQRFGSDTNQHDIELLADVALAAVSEHTFTITEETVEVLDVEIDETNAAACDHDRSFIRWSTREIICYWCGELLGRK